jgi:hypothetical protein
MCPYELFVKLAADLLRPRLLSALSGSGGPGRVWPSENIRNHPQHCGSKRGHAAMANPGISCQLPVVGCQLKSKAVPSTPPEAGSARDDNKKKRVDAALKCRSTNLFLITLERA